MEHNLYWPVYVNLEKELIKLSESIHIDDAQLEVYSVKITELLIRTVVEIESLAKNLYFANGGTKADGKDLYFDTDCMAHLVNIWDIDKKVVLVTSSNLFFEDEANRILTPLHKSNKRGTSSADWCKAYQAVKHNRLKELKKGNLKHFIRALAALYILNLYYRDEKVLFIDGGKEHTHDFSFGSLVFSVMKPNNISQVTIDGIYPQGKDFEKHIYVAVPDDIKYKELVKLLAEQNKTIETNLVQRLHSELKIGNLSPTSEAISKFISDNRNAVTKEVLQKDSRTFGQKIMHMTYGAELNKRQTFFFTPPKDS